MSNRILVNYTDDGKTVMQRLVDLETSKWEDVMSEFTKVEWLVDDSWSGSWEVKSGDKNIAVVSRFRDEAKANAQLIAAAPELFEACERLLSFVISDYESSRGWFGEATDDVEFAQKAIAKAKGQSK